MLMAVPPLSVRGRIITHLAEAEEDVDLETCAGCSGQVRPTIT